MGFLFHSTGGVKRTKEFWNESHTVNESQHAAKTKERPAGLRRRLTSHRPDDRYWPN